MTAVQGGFQLPVKHIVDWLGMIDRQQADGYDPRGSELENRVQR